MVTVGVTIVPIFTVIVSGAEVTEQLPVPVTSTNFVFHEKSEHCPKLSKKRKIEGY